MKFIFLFIFLFSCNHVSDKMVLKPGKNRLSLLFSHNIQGESVPCGCRTHPLGGLPNVYGLKSEIEKEAEVFYVDTGDMLFPTPVISDVKKRSSELIARDMVSAMDLMGLNYRLPGELDFSLGTDFYNEIWKDSPARLLVSNSGELKGQRFAYIEHLPHRIYLFSIANPALFDQAIFSDPITALESLFDELGLNYTDPFLRIIVLSHGGMEFDEKLADRFPQIDWILGSHDQSFTRDPFVEGNTKIVQVLNKNHYVGEIRIDFNKTKGADSFKLHEIHSELEKKVESNPLTAFTLKHKKRLQEIQDQEQKDMMVQLDQKKIKSYLSCVECHTPQYNFWKNTPHSLAMGSLIQAGEHKNQNCIGCHSLGFRKTNGFNGYEDLVEIREKPVALDIVGEETRDLLKLKENYFKEMQDLFKEKGSIRDMKESERSDLAFRVHELDKKHELSKNFSGVQCMHCHKMDSEHPFQFEDKKKSPKVSLDSCIACHTKDMAPEWYSRDERGLPSELDKEKAKEIMHKVSCPSYTSH